MMQIELPIVPMEHQYLITNEIPELVAFGKEIPFTVDFDGAVYLRQEGKGLLVGTYEQDCRHWALGGTPLDFGVELLPSDVERIVAPLGKMLERMPVMLRAGVKRVVNGGMVFTPDGNPIIGPLPGHETAFVAAGCMMGLSQSGGIGLAVARWIIDGEPGMDVFAMDVCRYGDFANAAYVRAKTRENYQRRFILPCWNEELPAARGVRTSPLYDRLAAAGAVFGVSAAYEVPLWYAPSGERAHEKPSFHRSEAFGPVAAECRAVREAVGLWETSAYCKLEIAGRRRRHLARRHPRQPNSRRSGPHLPMSRADPARTNSRRLYRPAARGRSVSFVRFAECGTPLPAVAAPAIACGRGVHPQPHP